MEIILSIVIIVAILSWIYRFRIGRHKADDSNFSQAGVFVDYNAKTLTYKGRAFPVSKVRSVRTEWQGRKNSNRQSASVVIEINDMSQPRVQVKFSGGGSEGSANKFQTRLILALEHAGCTF